MSVCYYDLETTGLNPPDHQGVEIIKIGATTDRGRESKRDFEVFSQPRGPIDPRATEVHGFYKINGTLYSNSDRFPGPIIPPDIERPGLSLGMFLEWLHQADCRYLVRFSCLVKYFLKHLQCFPGCP